MHLPHLLKAFPILFTPRNPALRSQSPNCPLIFNFKDPVIAIAKHNCSNRTYNIFPVKSERLDHTHIATIMFRLCDARFLEVCSSTRFIIEVEDTATASRLWSPFKIFEEACDKGSLAVAQQFYRHGVDLDSALGHACEHRHLKLINFLVLHIKSNERDMPKWALTPWDIGFAGACSGGHKDIAYQMMALGGKAWLDGGFEGACEGGHQSMVNTLIDINHAPNVDFWNRGLAGACLGGHLEIVKHVIDKGANDWNRGLECACAGGHQTLIKLMIEMGADDWTVALMGACRGGHIGVVQSILDKEPLHIGEGFLSACQSGQLKTFQYLSKVWTLSSKEIRNMSRVAYNWGHIAMAKYIQSRLRIA